MKVTIGCMLEGPVGMQQSVFLVKSFETPAAIVPGMELVDRVWEKPKKIESIELNTEDGSIYLQFREVVPRESFESFKAAYESCGWHEGHE